MNNQITSTFAALLLIATTSAQAVDFRSQIYPILNNKCSECHSEAKGKTKGKFAIDRQADMQKQVKAGEPAKSSIVISVTLPDDDEDVMPPKGKNRLTAAEVDALKQWIQEGASFDAASAPPAAPGGAPAAPAAGGVLAWTNTDGKKLQASFEGMDPNDAARVLLKAEDGTVYTYPVANLSPESQEQLKKLSGGR